MEIVLGDLIEPRLLAEITSTLAASSWADGRLSAGAHAAKVKRNEQLPGEVSQALRAEIDRVLQENPLFQACVLPKAWTVMFNRYLTGMEYGLHTDNPIMGSLRTDVSFTIFLSDPATYAGGELILESSLGHRAIKLQAGSAIFYPSTYLHRVAPVTQGVRLAVVGWVQSHVADAAKREILWDLEQSIRELADRAPTGTSMDLLIKTKHNLTRMWAQG